MEILKRLLDVVLSLFFMLLCLPILILVAIAIKLDSPGPVLYYRELNGSLVYRIGAQGKSFRYLKFRTMEHGNRGYKYEITRVGRIIRRWQIDRLPELFLVLIGKMSLVGPRPCTVEEYYRLPDEFFQAWDLKPGIIGPNQLKGRTLPDNERVQTDLNYIQNWSLLTDLKLIAMTPILIIVNNKKDPLF